MVEEIPGQRTGIVVGQGMDAEQTAQVDIDGRCLDFLALLLYDTISDVGRTTIILKGAAHVLHD